MADTGFETGGNRNVDIKEAVNLFFKNYVNFQGRSSRGAFWWWALVALIVAVVINIIDAMISIPLFGTLWFLATIVPSIALGVRRLHDTGKSGFWILIGLIPLIGFIVLIVFYCFPGQRMANAYGPDVEAGR